MGQKTSPIGFRTGVTLGWKSTWFAPKATFGDLLVEDQKIRKFIDKKFSFFLCIAGEKNGIGKMPRTGFVIASLGSFC